MNRLGIQSLNAGAPDLRLTGDQTQRGSYVQRRRAQMAGGGIMGSNAGSMLVAPTADGSRPGYGVWDKIKKRVGKLIPNELKSPVGAALAATAANYLPVMLPGGSDKTLIQQILGTDTNALDYMKSVMGGGTDMTSPEVQAQILAQGSKAGPFDYLQSGAQAAGPFDYLQNAARTGLDAYADVYGDNRTFLEKTGDYIRNAAGNLVHKVTGLPATTGTGTGTGQGLNIAVPMAIGAAAGEYQRRYLEDQPPFPGDETGIRFQTAKEAMADPTLRFKPEAQYANVAEGGRIGYAAGGPLVKKGITEILKKFKRPIFSFDDEAKMIVDLMETGKYSQKELMALEGDQIVEIYVRE